MAKESFSYQVLGVNPNDSRLMDVRRSDGVILQYPQGAVLPQGVSGGGKPPEQRKSLADEGAAPQQQQPQPQAQPQGQPQAAGPTPFNPLQAARAAATGELAVQGATAEAARMAGIPQAVGSGVPTTTQSTTEKVQYGTPEAQKDAEDTLARIGERTQYIESSRAAAAESRADASDKKAAALEHHGKLLDQFASEADIKSGEEIIRAKGALAESTVHEEAARKDLDLNRFFKNRTTGQAIGMAIGEILGIAADAIAGALGDEPIAKVDEIIRQRVQDDLNAQMEDRENSKDLAREARARYGAHLEIAQAIKVGAAQRAVEAAAVIDQQLAEIEQAAVSEEQRQVAIQLREGGANLKDQAHLELLKAIHGVKTTQSVQRTSSGRRANPEYKRLELSVRAGVEAQQTQAAKIQLENVKAAGRIQSAGAEARAKFEAQRQQNFDVMAKMGFAPAYGDVIPSEAQLNAGAQARAAYEKFDASLTELKQKALEVGALQRTGRPISGEAQVLESMTLDAAGAYALTKNPDGKISDKDLEDAQRVLGPYVSSVTGGFATEASVRPLDELQGRSKRAYELNLAAVRLKDPSLAPSDLKAEGSVQK